MPTTPPQYTVTALALPPVSPDTMVVSSWAVAINNAGEVVAGNVQADSVAGGDASLLAAIWVGGVPKLLPQVLGWDTAYGINDSAQVVGSTG